MALFILPEVPKFLRKAWDQTFKPIDVEQTFNSESPPSKPVYKTDEEFKHYFLGFPKKGDSFFSKAFYVLGGIILKPLLSVVKVGTEFLLSATAQGLHSIIKSGLELNYSGYIQKKANGYKSVALTEEEQNAPLWKKILAGFLTGLWAIPASARLLVRTVTSPDTSYYAAKKVDPVLGYVSGIFSFVGILAISIFAPHYGAALLAKMGAAHIPVLSAAANFISKGFAAIGNNSVIAAIAKPITKFFGAIGLGSSVTAATTGASAVGILVAARALLSTFSEYCANKYKSYADKKNSYLKLSSENLNSGDNKEGVGDNKGEDLDNKSEKNNSIDIQTTKKVFTTIIFHTVPQDTEVNDNYLTELGKLNPDARYMVLKLNNGENVTYRRNKKLGNEDNNGFITFSTKMEEGTVTNIVNNINKAEVNNCNRPILKSDTIFAQGEKNTHTLFKIPQITVWKDRDQESLEDKKPVKDGNITVDEDNEDTTGYGMMGNK